MDDSALHFYNELANNYQLIFADWQQTVLRQGQILHHLIQDQVGMTARTLLDCSCGIGTQAIGLALHGYTVHATDISPQEIKHAEENAVQFGASLTFDVADMRTLETQVAGTFDVVLSCDNALPHLLTRDDLALAAQSIWSKLNPNGLLIASIRDYDQLLQEQPHATQPSVIDTPEGRRIVFQVWNWAEDASTYHLHLFIVQQRQGAWQTNCYETVYKALQREELSSVLQAAGFGDIRWHMPAESGYYQPIVTARKR